MYKSLKSKIKSELQEITELNDVKDYPTMDFQKYPACAVRSVSKTGQYETTSEDYEEYHFIIYVLQKLDFAGFDPPKCHAIIEELVETIEDHFDGDEFMAGFTPPSGKVFLGLRPTNSKIFEEESGKFVVGEIELACRVSKSI